VKQKREDSANSEALEVLRRMLKICGQGQIAREQGILRTCAGLRFEDGQSMKKITYQKTRGGIIYVVIRSEIHIMGGWVCLEMAGV